MEMASVMQKTGPGGAFGARQVPHAGVGRADGVTEGVGWLLRLAVTVAVGEEALERDREREGVWVLDGDIDREAELERGIPDEV